jgi:hypothetical protein
MIFNYYAFKKHAKDSEKNINQELQREWLLE